MPVAVNLETVVPGKTVTLRCTRGLWTVDIKDSETNPLHLKDIKMIPLALRLQWKKHKAGRKLAKFTRKEPTNAS